MRITFVLDTFAGGGKERRCLQLIQGLNKRGYNNIQVIVVNNDIAYDELYNTNISLHIIDRKNKGLNFFQTLKEVYLLLNNFEPDVVQVWGLFSSIFTTLIRYVKSFKYIGAYVADCNRPKFLSFSRLFVVLSSTIANYIVGNSNVGLAAYRIPKRKGIVIYNGFNEDRFLKFSEPKEVVRFHLNITTPYVVSMIARVDYWKDHVAFINAAKLILKKRKDITFLIVGEGPNVGYLKTLLTEGDFFLIKFLGFRKDVENILQITDVSVLCTNSEKHKEGVSNAIMESMAFGVPVIATNDGGTPEIIKDGFNGYLIDPFNDEQLSSQMLLILNDKRVHNSLSMNAIHTVRTKFSLSKMVDAYEKMYISLMT